jgi:hypothetical protein
MGTDIARDSEGLILRLGGRAWRRGDVSRRVMVDHMGRYVERPDCVGIISAQIRVRVSKPGQLAVRLAEILHPSGCARPATGPAPVMWLFLVGATAGSIRESQHFGPVMPKCRMRLETTETSWALQSRPRSELTRSLLPVRHCTDQVHQSVE